MLDMSAYYIVGVILVIAAVILLFSLLLRRSRRRPDARTLYIQALQALLDGDQVAAFYRLKEVVSQDSDNVDAYIRLGRILSDRGNSASAIQVHSELLMRSGLTNEQLRSIRSALVHDYTRDGQINKAIELLSKEYDRNTRDRQIADKLLKLLVEDEQWEQAENVAERVYKEHRETFAKKYSQILVQRGDQLQEAGRGKKARISYKQAFKIDESNAEALVRVGDSYLAENRTDDAVKSWRELAESAPQAARLVINRLEKALFELGKFNALGGILDALLEKDPENQEAALAMAGLYVKKGDFDRAQEFYRQILDVEPENLPAALGLARTYREQGRIDEALNSLEKLYASREMAAEES